MTKLNELTLAEAGKGLRARNFSVRELWDACAEAAQAQNPELNAYLEIFDADDAAIESAQKKIDAGGSPSSKSDLLLGIPLAIKDNILIEGKIASAASKMLENYRGTYDAGVTEKLKAAGALFLGRTNMDEFALGGSTENSAFGVTKNPHDKARVAGGTSGGSAAAVAAHLAIAALGTDTGGSIRNPASYCGVVGLKPTYGAVSRRGVIAAASSFDQVGPLAKTVEDTRILLGAIHGHDPMDSTSLPDPVFQKKDVKKIGVPRHLFSAALDRTVRERFETALSALGHEVIDIEIPSAEPALAAYYIINFAEVSTNLARFDGMRYGLANRGDTLLDDFLLSREGFGQEARRRILLGTFVLSSGYIDAYYRKAVSAREALTREFDKAFTNVDIIATPTMPTPAFEIGVKADPLSLYLEDAFTVLANLTGMPAISIPIGAKGDLPIGIHFTAPLLGEETLFSVSEQMENAR